ncbi:MAG: hypothetical protein B7Z02_07825 [Rhodobacterales bacterium 32-67-9]|nr:MAG: hypothetical protein B7Z02_07825 [Rhodobacterales bacterium 32-67-9]
MRFALPALVVLPLVAACGPMSIERAERECFQRARLAEHPRGMVAVGTGSGGPKVKGEIAISSDFLQGKDPSALYDACVYQKSGQPPRRPLYTRSDWTG